MTTPKPRPAGRRPPPGEVRLIGGRWRRSKLPVPAWPGLRPTPDRVRETLFNWLGQDLGGWRCLDAFAGSGALGFEAASRGAASVLLVEREGVLLRSLEAARDRLGAAEVLRLQRGDGLSSLRAAAEASFELIFLDPPYDSELLLPALAAAARAVVPGGWVYAESAQPLPTLPEGLVLHRDLKAGQVHAHLLRRTG
ncbi:MAG: 16S rRNA (guanine(966)-N(2))-methyltransferase RsmD [Rubrivivax sp.]|nr:16S rRNA (guanine(966)-N(2))-methyltransferase RsmD [Rubrivivax sp.]